jgi:hypothetical protein
MDELKSSTGLIVFTNASGANNDDETAVREALDAAGVTYEVKHREGTEIGDVQLAFSDIE